MRAAALIPQVSSTDSTGEPMQCASIPDADTRLALLHIVFIDSQLMWCNCLSAEWLLLLDDLLDSVGVPHKVVTRLNGACSHIAGLWVHGLPVCRAAPVKGSPSCHRHAVMVSA